MAKIPISVIVPVYNRLEYIDECLDSALKQDVALELIVVDDCSTDGSYEHVREKYGGLDNVTVLRNEENSGVSYARNRAISVAQGEYIQFIDSDDFIIENSLGRLYELATENELDVLHSIGCYKLEPGENILRKTVEYGGRLPGEIDLRTREELIADFAGYRLNISSCEKLIRRELISENKLKFVRVNLQEDSLFNLELILRAKSYGLTSIIYNVVRNSEDSLSRKKDVGKIIKDVVDSLMVTQDKLAEIFSANSWQAFKNYEYNIREVLTQGLIYLLEDAKSWERGYDYFVKNCHDVIARAAEEDKDKLLEFLLFYLPYVQHLGRSRDTEIKIMRENVRAARSAPVEINK